MKCSECDEEIVECDSCGTEFSKGDCVFCSSRDFCKHFCENCSDAEGEAV
jgi:hypothetical protein